MFNIIESPIPGASLTAEPGTQPWKKPPKYSTIEDVAVFYADKLFTGEVSLSVEELVKQKMNLALITDILITREVMEGTHTLDTGVIVAPIVVEIFKTLLSSSNVEYKIGNEPKANLDMSAENLNKLFNETESTIEEIVQSTPNEKISNLKEVKEEKEQIKQKTEKKPQKGLMAKKEVI